MKIGDKIKTPKGIGKVHQFANDWVTVKLEDGSNGVFAQKKCKILV